MKSPAKKFIRAFLVSLIALIIIYGGLFYLAISTDLKNNFWLREVIEAKNFIAEQSQDETRRIIILSGSNSLLGINSEEIEAFTGIKTINYGLHAALPFSDMIHKLGKIAKQGDIVVLPLETDIYTRLEDEDYSRWLMKQVFNWHQDFFYNLTWDKKLKFMSMAPMELVFRNISNRFITKKRNKINSRFKTRKELTDSLKNIWSGKNKIEKKYKKSPYTYLSMNQWGDLTWNFKENSQEIEADAYDSLLLEPSEYFIEHYKILLQLAQQRNLQLIFTWSVSLKSALFNLDDFEDRQKVQNFKANLNKIGIDIDIKGELKDVHFTQDFFFDTSKHLNQEGVKIRTQALKNVIRENIR